MNRQKIYIYIYVEVKNTLPSRYRQDNISAFTSKHQDSEHRGQELDYKARGTARTRDCLSKQVREAVLISRSDKIILNSKSEWHQPALFRVHQEIEQG